MTFLIIKKEPGITISNPMVLIERIARRSLVASKDIGAQEQLTTENIAIKRPGIGIQPEFREMIVGMRAKRHIKADAIIEWKELEFSDENDR